jgi:Domain of unknown function (DUF4139)/N-terminal domain of unknown function (DUF4140)
MKKTLLLIASICSHSLCLLAQNPTKVVESNIEKVTVYPTGASISRMAKTFLMSGKTDLVFKGLSAQLDKQSIQLKGDGRFTVLAINHQINTLADGSQGEEITKLESQKQAIVEKIKLENVYLAVYQQEAALLAKNQEVKGLDVTLKAAELKEVADFQRQRMTEVFSKQLEINKNIKRYEEDIKKLNATLTQMSQAKEVSSSDLIVTISAKEAGNAAFAFSYYVGSAGWTPTYDIRMEALNEPLVINHKAEVYQYSGENWKDIKLSLSTVNPRKRGTAPELQTWYLGTRNDYSSYYNNTDLPNSTSITQVSGQVKDIKEQKALQGVSVLLKGTSLNTMTDANGYYRINIPPSMAQGGKKIVFSYVGFITAEKDVWNDKIDVELEEDAKVLSEVVVSTTKFSPPVIKADEEVMEAVDNNFDKKVKRSSPQKAMYGAIAKQQSLALDIAESETPTSKLFEIKVPYTILSDGKVYGVEMKTDEVPTRYEHYCIPKIDTDVFLTAKVIDWEQYNLLEGDANLYVEGTYTGKTHLDLRNKDTLSLSLGRDKGVLVNRVKSKDFREKQLIGSYKTESRGYTLTVRNTKKQAIHLVLDEQFPLSRFKEVEVLDRQAPEASITDETGLIRWQTDVSPNQEKKLGFSYAVKSPKGMTFGVE